MAAKTTGKTPLMSGLPRVYRLHNTPEGRAYLRAGRAVRQRFPGLPASADLWVREAALLAAQLEQAAQDEADARARGLRAKPAWLARHAASLRHQLLLVEEKLAAMVEPPKPKTIAETFGFEGK